MDAKQQGDTPLLHCGEKRKEGDSPTSARQEGGRKRRNFEATRRGYSPSRRIEQKRRGEKGYALLAVHLQSTVRKEKIYFVGAPCLPTSRVAPFRYPTRCYCRLLGCM